MKENALIMLLLLVFVGIWNPAFAQAQSVDIVTMKDGKVLRGKIVRYTPGQTLVFQQEDGQQLDLPDADIAKIQQGLESSAEAEPQAGQKNQNELPTAKARGLYTSSMLNFAIGNSNDEGLALGAGFSQVVGYQWGRAFGLGIGFGIDNYSRRGETVYPLFAEVRSFLPSSNKAGNFYAVAGGGYALAFPREKLDIATADGGPVGFLAIGYRAATVEGVDIFVDLGAKYQSAHFERKLYNGDVEIRDIDFRRMVIRVGIGLWKK